ncbi:MAG: hypothetical protein RBQ91_01065 [Acholeplasma sp.]|nr:hypothetical protein [Acholeplasma sp.]
MTIAKYRKLDLLIWTVVCIIIDLIGYLASQKELIFFYVTLSTPVLLILYIRWGSWGLIPTAIVAILHTVLYRNFDFMPMVLYIFSIFGIAASMIWFKIIRKNSIKEEVLWLILYFLTGYLAMFLIQALSQFILFKEIEWFVLITRHGLNIALGFVILMIAKRQEDLLVDMKTYLLKQIKERQQEEHV